LIGKDGNIRVTDFGVSRLLDETNLSKSLCSRWYKAPENIYGDPNYNYKVDIWSAGCVFAEMLIGKPLFHGDSDISQISIINEILGSPNVI